mmetsp:Transcript_15360/g.31219  ORF Transcript_15360/g.31219 Transcript_15360/m.31219 type:complete len:470 (-) Transcript_15360:185-1594(-)|eukprot:scaffold3185_cov161-Amphora_coffeaeformis.AAC.7
MRKRNNSSSYPDNNNNNLKKPPPSQVENEEEDDRKPAARSETDSQQETATDQSVGSNASSSTVPTVACTPMMISSPTAKGSDLQVHLSTIEENPNTPLQQITTQAALLGSTSALSMIAFVVMVLPAEALVALIVAIIAMMLLVFQLYQFAVQAYADVINGRGIGDYLPGWMFSMLVEDSIHEQLLTGDDFVLEWRHMALYFFPGLSRHQVDAFVDRLPARHRDFLRRPGAGHVLGNDFMQLVLGRERFPEVPPQDNTTAVVEGSSTNLPSQGAVLLPPPSSASRRLELGDDDSSAESDFETQMVSRHTRSLGLSSGSNDAVEQSASAAPPSASSSSNSSPPQAIVATPAAPVDDNDESDYDGEMTILTEAFIQGMNSMVLSPMLFVASRAADQVAALVASPSVSMTIFSGSIGLFGLWRGLWGRQGLRPNIGLHDRDVWATAVLGGGVAGALLFARSTRSRKRKGGKKK